MFAGKIRETLCESNDFLASGNCGEITHGGDEMPKQLDVDYIRALAHGMRSAAGEGIGIVEVRGNQNAILNDIWNRFSCEAPNR